MQISNGNLKQLRMLLNIKVAILNEYFIYDAACFLYIKIM
jgi:hypothetical protein